MHFRPSDEVRDQDRDQKNLKRAVLFFVAVLILLIGYISLPSSDAQIQADNREALATGEVVKIAEAPDGTVLWAKKVGDQTIYFPSATTVDD